MIKFSHLAILILVLIRNADNYLDLTLWITRVSSYKVLEMKGIRMNQNREKVSVKDRPHHQTWNIHILLYCSPVSLRKDRPKTPMNARTHVIHRSQSNRANCTHARKIELCTTIIALVVITGATPQPSSPSPHPSLPHRSPSSASPHSGAE